MLTEVEALEEVGKGDSDKDQGDGNSADPQHIKDAEAEFRQVGAPTQRVHRDRDKDRDDRAAHNPSPEGFGIMRRKDKTDPQDPHRNFNPEVIDNEHPAGFPSKEGRHNGNGQVAIVIHAGGKREGPSLAGVPPLEAAGHPERETHPHRHGGKSQQGWQEKVFRLAERGVFEDQGKEERRKEEVQHDRHQAGVRRLFNPAEPTGEEAEGNRQEDRQDGGKDECGHCCNKSGEYECSEVIGQADLEKPLRGLPFQLADLTREDVEGLGTGLRGRRHPLG